MYNLEQGHTTVVGRTREGKTYTVSHILKELMQGVLFYNTSNEELKGYIKVNQKTPFFMILDLLIKGQKLNYIPSSELKKQYQEISFLIKHLFNYAKFNKNNFIYIVVDEAHLFKGDSLDQVERIATGGLHYGLHGIFLSQRPANLSNTLMTQSSNMMIFFSNMESQYFKNYSIPIEEILKRIEKNGKYSFCTFDFKEIKDYKKI
jgi:hypothetical protein